MVGIAVGLLAICLLLVGTFTVRPGWNRYEWRLDRRKPYTVEHLAGGMAHAAIDQSEYMDRFRQETQPTGCLFPLGRVPAVPRLPAAALQPELRGRRIRARARGPVDGLAHDPAAAAVRGLPGQVPRRAAVVPGSDGRRVRAALPGGRRDWAEGVSCCMRPGSSPAAWRSRRSFHLFGALFPRPAIVGLLYAFFFETLLSELPIPGTLKRLSINYYTPLPALLGGGGRGCADGIVVALRPGQPDDGLGCPAGGDGWIDGARHVAICPQ